MHAKKSKKIEIVTEQRSQIKASIPTFSKSIIEQNGQRYYVLSDKILKDLGGDKRMLVDNPARIVAIRDAASK